MAAKKIIDDLESSINGAQEKRKAGRGRTEEKKFDKLMRIAKFVSVVTRESYQKFKPRFLKPALR